MMGGFIPIMETSYQNHYERTLENHYSWAFGGLDENILKNRFFFEKHLNKMSGNCVDLGAGSGFQSIALSEIGYDVLALDTSKKLLSEAESRSNTNNIRFINDDFKRFRTYLDNNLDLICCMGDTISHLGSLSEVRDIIKDSLEALNDKGQLFISYRDLSCELEGSDRVIPVRSDQNRILTCFLEYEDNFVRVTDLIYFRSSNGWDNLKSSYKKIKVPKEWLLAGLKDIGFKIKYNNITSGMNYIIAEK